MPHDMRRFFMLACAAGVAAFLGGCAKASVGNVQEVEAGTYSVGVSRTSGIATDANKTLSAVVDKAGEFCHAKGQKFLLKSAVGNSVVFRCVATAPSPE
jgi:outer membrane lipoprotein-sorting protein